MRIDYDLVRKLLFHLEEITDADTTYSIDRLHLSFKEYPWAVFRYHIKYLYDVGFIESANDFDDDIRNIEVLDITPLGRNFLDSIRDSNIWSKTKEKFHPLGSVALSIISEVGTSFIRQKLGL